MARRFIVLFVLCCLASTTFAARRRSVAPIRPEEPLSGLTESQLGRFDAGRAEFAKRLTGTDGLGPILNGRSCHECHHTAGVGGSSGKTVTRFGRTTGNGGFDPMISRGGPVLQMGWLEIYEDSPIAFRGEFVPPDANVSVRRITPPLFGLGLVDATPDTTFIALAAEQAARNDGTAGRVAMVDNLAAGMKTVGKFGWKAQQPTLFQFVSEAFLNELGVTNPAFPTENCRNGDCSQMKFNPRPDINDDGSATQRLIDFVSMLGPAKRGRIAEDVVAGELVFQRIGCESCHVSTLQTGPNDDPALDRVTYHPYSDFLLHDMGSLGDGMHEGAANGREMRTPPLWGARLKVPMQAFAEMLTRAYLHDGRARTLEAAIEAHDGQGRAARDRFKALGEAEREQLLVFLRSL